MIIDKIKTIATEIMPRLVEIRRHLHMHPELSFEEYETAMYIRSILEAWNIPYDIVASTGTIATIGHGKTNEVVYLRADIDALPIEEKNDVSYVSQNQGVMHACGHDVHTTCALGAAYILNAISTNLEHTIKVLFQPGEEKLPGGASKIIASGEFTKHNGKAILGQHVFPDLPAGQVGIRSGMYMASADEIYMTVKGKGGHAAAPHKNIDTILLASEIITGLQKIVSRGSNPLTPSVLSFGKINSEGGATNVIPDVVHIEGTFRTMNEEWRKEAHILITKMVHAISESMGGQCDIEIVKGYPFLYNEESLSHRVKEYMIAYLGADNVIDIPMRMTSEDFAFYTHELPGCFYRLGTGNVPKGITHSVHTPLFDIDEDALSIGAGLLAYLGTRV